MNAPLVTPTGETSLMIRRSFAVDQQTLWDALTRPEAIMKWMGAKMAKPARVDQDLRVGGAYQIEMIGHDGEIHRILGEYLEIDAPTRIAFTWAWYTTADRISRVTYALTPGDGATTLTLTHEKLYDSDVRDRHGQGWMATLDSLHDHLSGGMS